MRTLLLLFVVALFCLGWVQGQSPGIDCRGKKGFTLDPVNPCGSIYYYCKPDGSGARLRCDPDQAFSLDNRRCVPREWIRQCRKTTAPPPPPPTTRPTPAAPGPCQGRRFGYALEPSNPCGPTFYDCKAALKRTCPGADQGFDLDSGSCVPVEWLKRCVTTRPPPPTTRPTPAAPGPCQGRRTGFALDPSSPCAPFFFDCATGTGRTCPSNDEALELETGTCVPAEWLKRCRGAPAAPPQAPESRPPPSIVPGADCSRGAGDIPDPNEPCSSSYVSCLADGSSLLRSCAAAPQTKYDVLSNACLQPQFVQACGGTPTTTEKPNPPPTFASSMSLCSRQPDGDYQNPEEPCSALFVGCSNGQTSLKVCAGKTAFDSISSECLEPEFVQSCGGIPTEKPTTTPPTPPPTVDFPCAGKPAGNYPLGDGACKKNFVSCTEGGLALLRSCAEETFYDIELDQCLAFANVPECSGTPRPPTTTQPAQPPTAPPNFDCSGKEPRNYPASPGACDSVFFSCSKAGTPTRRECPKNLVYDEVEDECAGFGNVAACGAGAQPPQRFNKRPKRDGEKVVVVAAEKELAEELEKEASKESTEELEKESTESPESSTEEEETASEESQESVEEESGAPKSDEGFRSVNPVAYPAVAYPAETYAG